jgi:biopolymer transport protein ExbD
MPEVTLTPLIDTSLTILVIFMITAPAIQNAIKVDLPRGSQHEADGEKKEVSLSIDGEGMIYINNNPVAFDDIAQEYMKQPEESRYIARIHADKSLQYNTVMSVVEEIKRLNVAKHVVLSTQPA